MSAWFLLTTKLKSELRVKENLMVRNGISSFFPTYPNKKPSSAVGLPLFPRYIFAWFDLSTQLEKVRCTPGVSRVVAFGGVPATVSQEVIDCLRQRCDEDDVLQTIDLREGRTVRVTKGIFEGCQGIINEKRGGRRVQLLLNLAFDHSVKTVLHVSEIELERPVT